MVNHGVPEEVVRAMESSCEEFFRLPAEDKAAFYSSDEENPNRLFTGGNYNTRGKRYWRDCLRLTCPLPLDDVARSEWPNKPICLRAAVEGFVLPARALGMELLRLLCEGLGLRPDYFEGDLSGGHVFVNINHYPPCPEPERALGLAPHCDRNLITLLRQGSGGIPGLEVLLCRGGGCEWVPVPFVPGAFVVNLGHPVEIATNGVVKSVEHRAVPDKAAARTSVGVFVAPTQDCLLAPAEELVDGDDNPPRYRAVTYREFMRVYKAAGMRRDDVDEAFKI